jgi:hypothetical protein
LRDRRLEAIESLTPAGVGGLPPCGPPTLVFVRHWSK